MKTIAVSNNAGKTPAEKVIFGGSIQDGINGHLLLFPDGAPVTAKVKTVTDALKDARAAYENSHSSDDLDTADKAETAFDLEVDNVVLYVQTKVNADPANGITICTAAGLDVKKKGQKNPAPGAVTTGKAVFTNDPGKILLKIKKYPKYTKIIEAWISTMPADENSWKMIGTVAARKLMVDNLVSGTRYYFRFVARNIAGKSAPSNPVNQLAA